MITNTLRGWRVPILMAVMALICAQAYAQTFTCYSGDALTIGGWGASQKGKAYLQASDTAWRDVLNDLCLVDNQGNSWSPDMTGDFEDAYKHFSSWLLAPVRGSMAFNLSRQMAAIALTLEVGGYEFIDEPWVEWDGTYTELWKLIEEASDLVCKYPNTRRSSDPGHQDQEKYMGFFDGINNNVTSVCKEDLGTPQITITAYKFRDTNGNGLWDKPEEQAIPGWTIELRDSSNNLIDSQQTDSAGAVTFLVDRDLTATTTYIVREIIPVGQGWVATTDVQVSVTAEQDQTVKFGNWIPMDITAYKFRDTNGNGTWDGGETGIPNWTIELRFAAGNTLYLTETTDGSGKAVFTVDTDGTLYNVVEVIPAGQGWVATTATSFPRTAAQPVADVIFGNWIPMDITAYKFRDTNGNGTWDKPSEQPIANWTIELRFAGSNNLYLTEQTDSNGKAVFTVDTDGTQYNVVEVIPPGQGWGRNHGNQRPPYSRPAGRRRHFRQLDPDEDHGSQVP
jgi:hypothetical protein